MGTKTSNRLSSVDEAEEPVPGDRVNAFSPSRTYSGENTRMLFSGQWLFDVLAGK